MDAVRDALLGLDIPIPEEIVWKALDVGDYLLVNGGERMLVERKNIHDFCSTYMELPDRMDRMRSLYERTALIIEGNYKVMDGSLYLWQGNRLVETIPERTFYNFKLSIQERGSYFDVTKDLHETMRMICHWYEYLPRIGASPPRKTRKAVEWFAMLPGVGDITAFNVRSTYATPRDALALIEEWIPAKARSVINKW